MARQLTSHREGQHLGIQQDHKTSSQVGAATPVYIVPFVPVLIADVPRAAYSDSLGGPHGSTEVVLRNDHTLSCHNYFFERLRDANAR